jgi:hypothetical protein
MIPGVLGFLAGAGLFAATWKDVFPTISQIANLGNTILRVRYWSGMIVSTCT